MKQRSDSRIICDKCCQLLHSYASRENFDYEWGKLSMTALVNKLHKQQAPEERIQRNAPRVVDWRNLESYRESWKTWLK